MSYVSKSFKKKIALNSTYPPVYLRMFLGRWEIFFQNEEILWEQSDSIRKNNIRLMSIPQIEEREKGAVSLF